MKSLVTSLIYRYTNGVLLPGNRPYFDFLKKGATHLQLFQSPSKGRPKLGHKIFVPFKPLQREEVKQFFQTNNLTNKNIIVDVDSSHLLGVRKMLILSHLKKNVYKGVEQPIQNLTQTNPEFQYHLEELHFDDDIFFMTDPKFIHLWDTDKTEDQIDEIVQQFYDTNIDRGIQRLKYDYKFPQQFLYLIEQAHNFDNKIYFGGINQYDFRNVLWLYHTIDELKTIFVQSMHYWMESEHFIQSENKINLIDFQIKCREFINQQCYHIFQPYRYNKLRILRTKIGHSYTFAHQCAFHKAGMDEMNIEFGKQHGKATESDKIQKHAILEVMLGNLWNQPYSMSKFPNLGQNYIKLSQNDRQTIDAIFNKHCNIYLKAIQKFRDKHFMQATEKLLQKRSDQSLSNQQTR